MFSASYVRKLNLSITGKSQVAFSIELLEWGRTFSDFWGKEILLSRDSKWSRLKSSEVVVY